MTTQQRDLLAALAEAGWELAGPEDLHEWWADDVWMMRSVWSPQSSQFYLTFLVDPQLDIHRRRNKGEGVWAVKASRTLPTDWRTKDGEFCLTLGRGWEKELKAFVGKISGFRTVTAS